MAFLLDTCIISELSKKSPAPSVLAWMEGVEPNDLYVSVLTIAEIRRGIERFLPDDPRRSKLDEWYSSVDDLLNGRVLPFDKNMAVEWGRIMGASMRVGKMRPAVDMLIASTAKRRGMILVTRNVKDMENVGVEIFNPFEYGAKGDFDNG